jgi:pyruvate ferredoxin oxidoreductase gamma subunit
MYEIRIHSRGGQGGVTAARLLADAAFRDGKYATASPFYGAERRGAPVVSFVRIDDHPIRIYSQIEHPDLVVVLDPGVMDVVDVLQGLKDRGVILINSSRPAAITGYQTCQVDLTGIAIAHNLVIAGSPVLDTPLMGALARMGIVSLEVAIQAIRDTFTDERNVSAARAAYGERCR